MLLAGERELDRFFPPDGDLTFATSMDTGVDVRGDEARNVSREIAGLAFRGNGAQADHESR